MSDTTNALDRRPPRSGRSTAPRFYWELDAQALAEQTKFGLEDEGYLASDLNHGVRLLAVPWSYETWEPVLPGVDRALTFEAYSDAVAAILQVAAWHGIDPADVTAQALSTRQGVFTTAAEAAADRLRTYLATER